MTYKLSPKEKHNRPIHALMQNGYRFAFVNRVSGCIVFQVHYPYQVDLYRKRYCNCDVKELKSMLID